MAFKMFGYQFGETKDELDTQKSEPSIVTKENDDGSVEIMSSLGAYGGIYQQGISLDTRTESENAAIQKYRDVAMLPEVDFAIEEIVSEAIHIDEKESPVSINLDDVNVSDNVKKKIEEAFQHISGLLQFKTKGHDIFRRWYIDGRYNLHVVIDKEKPREGIKDLRFIDPKKIKKIREIQKVVDQSSGAQIPEVMKEYYLYKESGIDNNTTAQGSPQSGAVTVSPDSIAHANSGILDHKNGFMLSHLHKALTYANSMRLLENALIIYRLSRAPERRAFYIEVGNLPGPNAESYVRKLMEKYKTKVVFDANTGEIKDDRKFQAMTEDYWLPRREGRGTEVSTIGGGEQLGKIEDVEYFKEKLYRSLNVPYSRIAGDDGSGLVTRTSEISRDEMRFAAFISRLRSRFNMLFDDLMSKHLILTGVMNEDDWEVIRTNIRYDYIRDNLFTELFEAEVMQNRLSLLRDVSEYVGTFFSKDYVARNILMMSEDEIKDQQRKIAQEKQERVTRSDEYPVGQFPDPQQMESEEPKEKHTRKVLSEKTDGDELSEDAKRLADSIDGFISANLE